MAWIPLLRAVELYFRHKGWATPKELINQLYPIFKRQYSDRETLRRNIHRILIRSSEVTPHSLKPFYVHKNSSDWFNFFISQLAKTNRLEMLYHEGFTVLYSGEICIEYPCLSCGNNKEVFDGKLILIPSINSKENFQGKHCLLIAKKFP